MNGEVHPVYLVDIGRSRIFDLDREPPGFVAARIITMRADRTILIPSGTDAEVKQRPNNT